MSLDCLDRRVVASLGLGEEADADLVFGDVDLRADEAVTHGFPACADAVSCTNTSIAVDDGVGTAPSGSRRHTTGL